MASVRTRADAICAKNGISLYRLGQLLRVDQSALKRRTEGSQPLDWVLLRCEEEGLSYFERKEDDLGKYRFKR